MTEKYIRFVCLKTIDGQAHQLGIIRAATMLEGWATVSAEDILGLNALWQWFNKNLDIPDKLSRSAKRHADENAISWFKPTAAEHISKARDIVKIIERNGVLCEMLTTQKPGYVVYEDEYQIASIPYKDGF